MSGLLLLVLATGFLLGAVNGANDVSKGIATLVGSGVVDAPRAIRWGTLCTALGGLAGWGLGGAMLATFGNGLLVAGTTPSLGAALATLLGASAWVWFATRTGLPVSTTHALVGSLAGSSLAGYGLHALHWSAFAGKLVLPLLVSPLVAFLLTSALLRLLRASHRGPAPAADCLCVETEGNTPLAALAPGGSLAAAVAARPLPIRWTLGSARDCPPPGAWGLRLTLDSLHWATSGATSFARGLNDAPKMVALLLAALLLAGPAVPSTPLLFVLVTAGMVTGSLVGGRRVTHVLAEKVTPMDAHEGFVANLAAAALVTAGAVGGLPMSTTHVASCAIVGVGLQRGTGSLNRRTVRELVSAWVVTAPLAALLGAAAFALVARL